MKVVFLWSGMSGYMAACWREFARLPTIEPHYFVDWYAIDWDEEICRGIPNFVRLRSEQDQHYLSLERQIRKIGPDVVIVCGWHIKNFRRVVSRLSGDGIRFVLAMDTPYRRLFRQFVARYVLRRYLRHFVMVIVAGERSFQYAQRLGFPDHKIKRGVYGIDADAFRGCAASRDCGPWPRDFLFVGRIVESKGINELACAYRLYREQVANPWGLTVCGTGAMARVLGGIEGIKLTGFVQPSELPAVYTKSGAFLLPSRYEPWGVVLAEACAAGMPVVCSESVGAAIDLVRPYFNGLVFGTESISDFGRMLMYVHARTDDELRVMGHRSQLLAEPYSAINWANRMWQYLLESEHY